MFIKIANNRKKIIDTALAAGYRPKGSIPEQVLVSNFVRVQNSVISSLAVSYRRSDPAVKIQHFHKDGTREELQRIILSKKTWEELVSRLEPVSTQQENTTERKKDLSHVRNGATV